MTPGDSPDLKDPLNLQWQQDSDIDPVCGRATDPDMAHSLSLGTNDTIALGGSLGHLGLYGPGSTLNL